MFNCCMAPNYMVCTLLLSKNSVLRLTFMNYFSDPINMSRLKAGKSPNEGLSLTNRIVLNPRDHAALGEKRHVRIILPSQHGYIFTVQPEDSMSCGKIPTFFLFK